MSINVRAAMMVGHLLVIGREQFNGQLFMMSFASPVDDAMSDTPIGQRIDLPDRVGGTDRLAPGAAYGVLKNEEMLRH